MAVLKKISLLKQRKRKKKGEKKGGVGGKNVAFLFFLIFFLLPQQKEQIFVRPIKITHTHTYPECSRIQGHVKIFELRLSISND